MTCHQQDKKEKDVDSLGKRRKTSQSEDVSSSDYKVSDRQNIFFLLSFYLLTGGGVQEWSWRQAARYPVGEKSGLLSWREHQQSQGHGHPASRQVWGERSSPAYRTQTTGMGMKSRCSLTSLELWVKQQGRPTRFVFSLSEHFDQHVDLTLHSRASSLMMNEL